MLLLEECSYKRLAYLTKIFINGAWIGCSEDPLSIVKKMKLDRRK